MHFGVTFSAQRAKSFYSILTSIYYIDSKYATLKLLLLNETERLFTSKDFWVCKPNTSIMRKKFKIRKHKHDCHSVIRTSILHINKWIARTINVALTALYTYKIIRKARPSPITECPKLDLPQLC